MRAPESSPLFPTSTPTHQPLPSPHPEVPRSGLEGRGRQHQPRNKLIPPPKPPSHDPPVPAQAARSRRTVGAGMPGEVEVAPSPAVTDDLARPHPGHRAHRALVGAGPSRGRSFTTESLGNMGRGVFHLYPATPDDRHRDGSRPMTQQPRRHHARAALWHASTRSQSRALGRINSHGAPSSGTISTHPPSPSLDVPISPPGSSTSPSSG